MVKDIIIFPPASVNNKAGGFAFVPILVPAFLKNNFRNIIGSFFTGGLFSVLRALFLSGLIFTDDGVIVITVLFPEF